MITQANLERLAEAINQALDRPLTPYTKKESRCYANVGRYYVQMGHRAYNFVEMTTEGGGIRTTLYGGTKQDLYDQMQAFLEGVRVGQESSQERQVSV